MNHRHMNTVALLLATMALAGCGTVYKPPMSGPTATLILPPEAVVSFYDDDECGNMRRVGEDGAASVLVTAGQPIHLSARRVNEAMSRVCAMTIVFTPAADATYVVQHSGLAPECRGDLLRVAADGVTLAPEPTVAPYRMRGYCDIVFDGI